MQGGVPAHSATHDNSTAPQNHTLLQRGAATGRLTTGSGGEEGWSCPFASAHEVYGAPLPGAMRVEQIAVFRTVHVDPGIRLVWIAFIFLKLKSENESGRGSTRKNRPRNLKPGLKYRGKGANLSTHLIISPLRTGAVNCGVHLRGMQQMRSVAGFADGTGGLRLLLIRGTVCKRRPGRGHVGSGTRPGCSA